MGNNLSRISKLVLLGALHDHIYPVSFERISFEFSALEDIRWNFELVSNRSNPSPGHPTSFLCNFSNSQANKRYRTLSSIWNLLISQSNAMQFICCIVLSYVFVYQLSIVFTSITARVRGVRNLIVLKLKFHLASHSRECRTQHSAIEQTTKRKNEYFQWFNRRNSRHFNR